ncbi:MAG: hypothetical protein JWP30_735 [Homoserinimonas sp.]|jgi:hypothetical protein|nr:hypothetical protein [Homoserinimonas sp.]
MDIGLLFMIGAPTVTLIGVTLVHLRRERIDRRLRHCEGDVRAVSEYAPTISPYGDISQGRDAAFGTHMVHGGRNP